jgi:E3 ubiquitin-protein ligase HUWE1
MWSFYQAGGLEALLKVCDLFTSRIAEVSEKSQDARTEQEKKELVHSFGGLKVALHLLHPIISFKAMESGQAHLIITRDKKDTDPEYFETHNFLVKLRLAALPTIYSLWTAPWLVQSPAGVSRAIVRTVLELVSGEGEESGSDPSQEPMPGIPTPQSIPRPPGPDENRVRVLTDMGFPRSAAERALVRTHNNVNAAAELLVNQPFPLPPDPEPEPAPQTQEAENPPVENTPPPPTEEPIAAEANEAPAETSTPETSTPEPSQEQQASSPPPESSPEQTSEPEAKTEEPAAPPGRSAEEWRAALKDARQPLIQSLSRQALLLIDEHHQLLFDLQKAFTKGSPDQKEAIQNLVDDIKAFSPQAYDVQEQPLANRCRLLALVLCEPPNPLSQETTNVLLDNLLALLSSITIENPPKWLAAHLLVTEALFTLAEEPRVITLPNEGEPVVPEPIHVGPSRTAARNTVFKLCLRLLSLDDLQSDELLSVLRLFVLFTRQRDLADQFIEANGAGLLFQRLRASPVNGGSSYIATILRHLVEDETTIRNIMQHGIKRYFTTPRPRIVEVATYVKNCSSIALRDVEAFIESTKTLCQMSSPYSPTPRPEVSLRPDVVKSVTGPKPESTDMVVDGAPTNHTPSSSVKLAEAVVHLLINELMTTMKVINERTAPPSQTDAPSTGDAAAAASNPAETTSSSQPQQDGSKVSDPKEDADLHDKYQYVCFLMQCLSELLLSYDACKVAFLSYSPKKKTQTPAKDTAHNRFRTATLHFFLTDLVTFGTVNPQPEAKLRSRTMLCEWAITVVISLCAESSSNSDPKEVSADLVSVRKYVLETISRTIKDPPTSENLDAKYGRLLALSELCNRLLTARFNALSSSRKNNAEVPTHVSKTMLEKNFVSTLTTALSEIDLNYPHVRSLVTAILKPLQYL